MWKTLTKVVIKLTALTVVIWGLLWLLGIQPKIDIVLATPPSTKNHLQALRLFLGLARTLQRRCHSHIQDRKQKSPERMRVKGNGTPFIFPGRRFVAKRADYPDERTTPFRRYSFFWRAVGGSGALADIAVT